MYTDRLGWSYPLRYRWCSRCRWYGCLSWLLSSSRQFGSHGWWSPSGDKQYYTGTVGRTRNKSPILGWRRERVARDGCGYRTPTDRWRTLYPSKPEQRSGFRGRTRRLYECCPPTHQLYYSKGRKMDTRSDCRSPPQDLYTHMRLGARYILCNKASMY